MNTERIKYVRKKIFVALTAIFFLMQILVINAEAASITRTEVSNRLNIIANQYAGKTSWPSSFGSQCYSFAHFVFNTVFERSTTVGSYSKGTEYKFNVPASDVKIVGCLAPGYTDAQLEALLDLAQPGDYVQLKRRTGSAGPHSEIVLNVDSQANTITILDANSGSISNQVRIYTQNYFVDSNVKSFRNWNQGVTIYRYKDYQVDVNNPFGSIDSIETTDDGVRISGWAIDKDAPQDPVEIHIYVGGAAGSGEAKNVYRLLANQPRDDIAEKYPEAGSNHGYNGILDITGTEVIYIYLYNIGSGENVLLGAPTVTGKNYNPFGSIDAIETTYEGVRIRGWAIDRDAPQDPVELHIYVGGAAGSGETKNVYKLLANQSRDDIAEKYPDAGSNHGYNGILDITGTEDIYIYLYNIGEGENTLLGVSTVTGKSHNPVGSIDSISSTCEGVRISGWGIDGDALTESLDVHIYVGGAADSGKAKNVCQIKADIYREDLEKKFSIAGGKHGYNALLDITGTEDIYIYLINKLSGENTLLGISTVSVEGHTVSDQLKNKKDASCTEDGYSGDKYCSVCNQIVEKGKTILKLNHSWDDGNVTKSATCTEKGVRTYTCANCKGTKVEEIPATGHQHTELQNVKEATYTEEGYTGDTYCADCGELIQKGTSIPKLTVNESAAVITVVGDKVAAGRDVTVSVDISKNSGIAGFSYDINYDEQAMTLKSVSAGDLISGNGQLSINKNVVNWYTSDNVNGDGNLLKIVFTVASDAQPSTYPVSISLHDGKKNLVDENGTFVEANYVGGRIAVTRGMLGDLNGDDDITIADVVILNRHVLGKASISSDRLMFADITGDDDITIGDVVLLNRHVLGKVNILSEEMTALNELVLGTERVGDAENETGMKIYADDINIKAGTTVDIPVKISGNTGLAGFALTVQVPEGYTLNSIKAGNMLANGTFTVNGSNCTWYTADNMTANGVFMTLNVSASKTAKSGQIIIGVKDGKANNLSDEIGCTVAADFEPVTITIDMESECEINGHKGGTATCTEKAVCTVCGKDYGEVDPKNHTGQKETRNKKEATCTETGYTGDTYCKACGVKMSSGKSVAKTGHEWNAGVVTKKPTVTKTGVKTYTCKSCKSIRTETIKATGVLPPGTVVKDTASNGMYKMAKDGLTLEFTKMISTTRKTLTIPSVVKVKGTSCKVTSIAANALKNNKTLEKVVIGSNISVIGSNAFSGCIKLTTVSGGSNITKYGDGAFYNCGKLKSISINKKATAIGAKAFYKCISLAKVTLPSTVKSIGSYAFYGCKNLKSITIGSTGLNSDKIGKDAFKGIYSKATISVPRGKAAAYKKLLISKGVSKSAIIK